MERARSAHLPLAPVVVQVVAAELSASSKQSIQPMETSSHGFHRILSCASMTTATRSPRCSIRLLFAVTTARRTPHPERLTGQRVRDVDKAGLMQAITIAL